jgi:peptidoglycan/LPS O-acetylase OafA/YrhL
MFWGGIISVDLFFVMSGYLITTLLMRERLQTGQMKLKLFYVRRALRLLPALAIALVGTGLVVAYVGDNWGGISYWKSALAAVFYVGNWVAMTRGQAMGLLSPTWSLAIEEQFYFLWPPILVWLLLRRRTKQLRIALSLIVLIVAMAVLRAIVYSHFGFVPAYNSTVTHGDGLLMGCLLALFMEGESPILGGLKWLKGPKVGVVAPLGVFAIFLIASLSFSFLMLGGYSVLFLLTCAWVGHLALARENLGAVGRFLSMRPLVYLGRISYGLYIFHYPLFYLARHTRLQFWPVGAQIVTYMALALVVATVSWVFVERRALNLKDRFTPLAAVQPLDAGAASPQT